ncbi:MAG: hypothetical protein DMD81_05960, partial [Candidatus Rokuibacteriota bacterium]
KSEVYFFSTRLRLNQTWGTAHPLTIRDAEFGAVQVRAYGIYSYRINAPRIFFQKVSGTRESYLVGDLEGQLRGTLVATLTDHFAESRVPFLDMAANQVELAAAVRDRARPLLADLGLALETFQIENISLPDELQKRLDERIGMGIVGNPGPYTQFQVARSIPVAAAEGGVSAPASRWVRRWVRRWPRPPARALPRPPQPHARRSSARAVRLDSTVRASSVRSAAQRSPEPWPLRVRGAARTWRRRSSTRSTGAP